MISYETSSIAETIKAGSEFSGELSPGDIVSLLGDIGAGKTHFIKGIVAGFGYLGSVTSPTFNIVVGCL